MKKIHVTTLGCSKNTVDSEVLMGQLEAQQYQMVAEPDNADVLILNTCGFIKDAKEESIQAIFEALQLKENDPAKKVYVAGCLSQRYRKEIEKEIPEVDAIFGTEEFSAIVDTIGRKHAAEDNIHRARKISTPRHFAYLKISEGCNHTCAFCAIPGIRGRHRSRSIESLVGEAKKLVSNGAKEIICISQDTSYFGRDLESKTSTVELARKLQEIEGINWLRFLYWYPTNFPFGILDLMQPGNKVVPYIDMPIQHISNNVLRAMRRGDTRDSLLKMYENIRNKVPNIALRTTLILGHPGETDADFRELYDFVSNIKFDRVGTFVYSDEENTTAFDLDNKVPAEVAIERQKQIMELQQGISLQKNQQMIGQEYEVLIDEYIKENNLYIGRTYKDAPEIDNEVHINGIPENHKIKIGEFVKVKIIDATEYDLEAQLI